MSTMTTQQIDAAIDGLDFAMFDTDTDRKIEFDTRMNRLRDQNTGRFTGWYDGNGNGKGYGDNISAAMRILRSLGWDVPSRPWRGARKVVSPTGECKVLARRPLIRLANEEYRKAVASHSSPSSQDVSHIESMVDDNGDDTNIPAIRWEDF